jgi:SWI/SNF-related matrix-associated actin-dependent regulator of chromatin subfamily A member 5
MITACLTVNSVTATMKPYQLSGLSFLVHLHNNGFSGILGDEMGLGKTLQTLSLFQYLEENDQSAGVISEEPRPYLVVCPLSVLDSWVNEAKKWVPQLRVLRFHGTAHEREHLKKVALGMEDARGNETAHSKNRKASRKAGIGISTLPTELGAATFKIFVTTYEAFQAEQSWFKHAYIWRYVILDEGHRIKNNTTNISNALKSVSAEYRLILTGTPLQNNLVELWGLLAWLYPDVFVANTDTLFKESFDLTLGKVNQKTMNDARRLLELIMLRRMKDSVGVNLGLPPKEEVLLYVPLTPMQRTWYMRLLTRVGDAMLDDLFADVQSKERDAVLKETEELEALTHIKNLEGQQQLQLDDDKGAWQETATIMKQVMAREQAEQTGSQNWRKLMNLVMQLRKCCSHPYLLPGAIPDPYYLGEHVIRASGKFIVLEKLLKHSIYEQKKKVLIFSGFTHTLDCCEDLLTLLAEQGDGFKYLRFDGSTARARRNLDIRLFNDSTSDYKVMLVSTRAGGLGINLTSAEDVIFLDEDWNPQITLQAEARAHRIGQTKKVTIYKLCTQGTVEEQMMGRIRKKLYLSAKITESMRNIHGDKTQDPASDPLTEDMPQMDTSQLKSLVRRGAQTLSHPEINVTEMLSWDFDTMLQRCRDKPSDPLVEATGAAAVDEQQWLATMERVQCAVFDGKRHQREVQAEAKPVLPDTVTREDRRRGKNVTVLLDGYYVSKESMNCADWEAVPTFAGKNPRLAEPKRAKRRELSHEAHCLICFEEAGKLLLCKGCPRAYHYNCLDEQFQGKADALAGFYCSQHECIDCRKKTGDAGGLIYRCRWCDRGYCEDCLEWGKEELIGNTLPEFEILHEDAGPGGFYIKCPTCKGAAEDDPERMEWMLDMEKSFADTHKEWLKVQEKGDVDLDNLIVDRQRELERPDDQENQSDREEDREEDSEDSDVQDEASEEEELKDAEYLEEVREKRRPTPNKKQKRSRRLQDEKVITRRNKKSAKANSHLPAVKQDPQWSMQNGRLVLIDDDNAPSPPALTDTSLANGGSGISTPRLGTGSKRRPVLIDDVNEEYFQEKPVEKKRKVEKLWQMDTDPLLQGYSHGYSNGYSKTSQPAFRTKNRDARRR